jgi:hypothetical protein
VLSSCSPKHAELLLDTHTIAPHALVARVRAQEDRIQSIVGNGSITFESNEVSGSASFELTLRTPDSLLLLVEGPFGIDLGTIFLSRGKYVIFNSMENRVITGTPTGETIRSVIPFGLTLDQILGAFRGAFPLPQAGDSILAYAIDDGYFFLSCMSGALRYKYWIDNGYLLVTRFEMSDADGHVLIEARAFAFTEDEGADAPRRIMVSFPEEERKLNIFYSAITLNDPHPSFVFSLPSNARTDIR